MNNTLAVVTSEVELDAVKRFALEGKNKQGNITVLCCSFWPSSMRGLESLSLVSREQFFQAIDLEQVEERCGFFAMNWYRFDKGFEEKAKVNGISLGFVHENEFSHFFREIFFTLRAIEKAFTAERPSKVVACRNSFSGNCVGAFAKSRNFGNVVFLDSKQEKGFSQSTNITRRKWSELREKLPLVFSEIATGRKTSQKKTVFVRSRGYIGGLKRKLQKDNSLRVVSLDEFLLRKLLNPVNLLRYASKRVGMARRFQLMLEEFLADRSLESRFVFDNINFQQLLRPIFQRAAKRDWPEFVFLIETLSRLFESERPNGLVLWEDFVPFERICALLAKRTNTASLVVQHGVINADVDGGNWIRGFAPLTADRIAVWGPIFRDVLVRHNVPESRIAVSGAARFDGLHKRRFDGASLREKIGVLPGEKLVVFAPELTFSRADSKKTLLEMSRAAAKFTKNRLVVKVHPTANPDEYSRAAGANVIVLQNRDLDRKNMDLFDLLAAADAVVIQHSTVGMDAMVLGKPAVVIGEGLKVYNASDAVLRARDSREMEKSFGVALGNSGARKELDRKIKRFAYDFSFEQDGKAAERLHALVKSMIGSSY